MLNDESVNEGRKNSQASDTQGGNLTFLIISKSFYVSKLFNIFISENQPILIYVFQINYLDLLSIVDAYGRQKAAEMKTLSWEGTTLIRNALAHRKRLSYPSLSQQWKER